MIHNETKGFVILFCFRPNNLKALTNWLSDYAMSII